MVTARRRHPRGVVDPLVRSVQSIGDRCLSPRKYEPVFFRRHVVSFVIDLPETSRYDRCEHWIGSVPGRFWSPASPRVHPGEAVF